MLLRETTRQPSSGEWFNSVSLIVLMLAPSSPNPNSNSFAASGDFCHLLITYANSVDPDQDRQNIIDIYSIAKYRKLVASFPYTKVPGANSKAILVNQAGKI